MLVFNLTIFSLQQLVDDVAELLHFRRSGDGEGDVIHHIPTTEKRVFFRYFGTQVMGGWKQQRSPHDKLCVSTPEFPHPAPGIQVSEANISIS